MKKFSKMLSLVATVGMASMMAAPAAQAQSGGLAVTICLGSPLRVLGLTSDQRLICFAEGLPQFAPTIGFISGLTGDTKIVGIDYRRADGKLYGVGNAGGVYSIAPLSAIATKASQLTVPLSGTIFGVDFNPVNGALRIISNAGQNLRHSLMTNLTVADSTLTYGTGTALGVAAAAYTNNDAAPETATTLLVIDVPNAQTSTQSPPNNGTLFAVGKLQVGATGQVGFDIFSLENNNGTTAYLNKGYASIPNPNNGQVVFHQLDLTIGKVYPVAPFTSNNNVIDIAVPVERNLLPGVALRLPFIPVN